VKAPLPELNEALIERVLAHIEANPENWDQRWFSSFWRDEKDGPHTHCFGGWAARFALESAPPEDEGSVFIVRTDPHTGKDYRWAADSTMEVAQEALGFTGDEAFTAFFNSMDVTEPAEMRAVIDGFRAARR